MKKYVKPELFYERYELSQHIADCAWEMNQGSKENCNASPDLEIFFWLTEENTLFTDTPRCNMIPGVHTEDYCYQSGADGMSTHNS